MLKIEKMKREKIEDIKKNEWLKSEMNEYMFKYKVEKEYYVIENDDVSEVCEKLVVKENEVKNEIISGEKNEKIDIEYNLIIDNKRIEDEDEKEEMKELYVERRNKKI
jgi:hypothetical protein